MFRDGAVPIYSNASFDPAALSGSWRQVGHFGAGCRPGGASFENGVMTARLCINGSEKRIGGPYTTLGPGRFLPAGEAEPWWILWVDVGERSMAIGTPSGSFGVLLDREGAIPPDRLTAAREIFDWNGYDLARFSAY